MISAADNKENKVTTYSLGEIVRTNYDCVNGGGEKREEDKRTPKDQKEQGRVLSKDAGVH